MTGGQRRADPSAASVDPAAAFEPFHLERETKPDGRSILFYSWPEGTPVPAGVGVDPAPAASSPPAEPWSPETQPADAADVAPEQEPSERPDV